MQTLQDPVAEGRRVAQAAAERGVPLRLMGGVAVAISCPSSSHPPLEREYADIDLVTTGAAKDGVVDLMEAAGYQADREFNTLHGHRRLFFWDGENERQADVFVDEARLCHRVDFRKRLEIGTLTLPVADLTVLKLQVVETNEKDHLDLCALLSDHELTTDESGVNVTHIANLAATDWGLWKTMDIVAQRTERFARALPSFAGAERVTNRLRKLREELDRVPKSRAWKLRAKLGERKRWYELPEEVR